MGGWGLFCGDLLACAGHFAAYLQEEAEEGRGFRRRAVVVTPCLGRLHWATIVAHWRALAAAFPNYASRFAGMGFTRVGLLG